MLSLIAKDNTVLIGGVVSSVKFETDKAIVNIDGNNKMALEFRNNKRRRADNVRKLKLKPGEYVIASGSKARGSSTFNYGFDIQRNGKVSSGQYQIISGKVANIVQLNKNSVISLVLNNYTEVKFKVCNEYHIQHGDLISCLCYVQTKMECMIPCKNGFSNHCQVCKKQKTKKLYNVLQIENYKENSYEK